MILLELGFNEGCFSVVTTAFRVSQGRKISNGLELESLSQSLSMVK